MKIPQGGVWYACLGQMGQDDRHSSSLLLIRDNPTASFSGRPLPAVSLQDLFPLCTGVRLTHWGMGSHHCTDRQLELQKMEIVACRVSELNYLGRGSENLQGWYRTRKKTGRRRRAEVEGSRSMVAFESP